MTDRFWRNTFPGVDIFFREIMLIHQEAGGPDRTGDVTSSLRWMSAARRASGDEIML